MLRFKYFLLLLSLVSLASCSQRDRYIAFSGYAQGGTYTVKLNVKGVRERPQAIKDSVDRLLQRIDNSISGYNKGSLLSRMNAGERIAPDDILMAVYDSSYLYWKFTHGAFDVAAGPLFDIWGFGFSKGEMPEPELVRAKLEVSGMNRLSATMGEALSPDGSLSAMDLVIDGGQVAPVLNFNAIAQGFTCDLVAAYLHSLGVKDMLVDIGEIWCEGLNPDGRPWGIGIDAPQDGNNTPGADIRCVWSSDGDACGLVTSGNYRKFYVRNGRKYAHTIDPRNGYPVDHTLLSSTIKAPSATAADALATYCMVIGTQQAREFILSRPELEACLISADSTWISPGFTLRK